MIWKIHKEVNKMEEYEKASREVRKAMYSEWEEAGRPEGSFSLWMNRPEPVVEIIPEPEPEPELVIEEVPIIEVDPKAYEIQKLKDQLAELQTLKELDKEEEAEIIEEVIEAEGE